MTDHPPRSRRVKTRKYDAPARAAKAAETRRRILDAAHDLFVTQGFAATTIDEIAARADVSRPTVFVSVGGKPEILKQVRDVRLAGDDEPVPMPERRMFLEVWHEPDPARTLRLYARNMRRIHGRAARIERVLQAAAQADPALQDLAAQARSQRRFGCGLVTASVLSKGDLRPGLTERAAGDLMYALAAADMFLMLTDDCHWSRRRYETWLAQSLVRDLLGTGPEA